MSICDWFSNLFPRRNANGLDTLYSDIAANSSDRYAALLKSLEGYKKYPRDYVALHTCPPFEGNPADCALNKKPDTVESVLNQFIALGHDKPKVVIKGVVKFDGSESYDVYIGEEIWHTRPNVKEAESEAVSTLKWLLGRLVVETVEITY